MSFCDIRKDENLKKVTIGFMGEMLEWKARVTAVSGRVITCLVYSQKKLATEEFDRLTGINIKGVGFGWLEKFS